MRNLLVPLGIGAAVVAFAVEVPLVAAKMPITGNVLLSTPVNMPLTITPTQLIGNQRPRRGAHVLSVGNAVNGTVSLGDDGAIVFQPAQDTLSDGRFDYTIADTTGAQSTASVYVAIEQTPLSIWSASVNYKISIDNDTNSAELGLKFSSDVNGQILGIRFYKSPQDTGTHPVSLWSVAGKRLATATSVSESASGWQEVRFATPVPISAGQTYLASYHSSGRYSVTESYFTQPINSGVLHAPASSTVSGNGLYSYGTAVGFPTTSWQDSNYWVDVVFQTTASADVTPPTTPSNFKATAAPNRIDLAWGASTDDSGQVRYQISRNGKSKLVTARTVSDTGLAAETTYTYALTAYDAAGNASGTVYASATTPPSVTPTCAITAGENVSLAGQLPFPPDNPWNQDISGAAVDPNSASILATTNLTTRLHADFGSGTYNGARIGIPYMVVAETQPLKRIDFTAWPKESDPGPYPFPANAPIEGFGSTDYNDRHVLVLQRDCTKPNQLGKLYETFGTYPVGNYPTAVDYWQASNGAVYDLNSNGLRPAGWTSADAAGLPIFPGLVRYDEVAAGEIRHALRFTLAPGYTRKAYVAPARHWASSNTGSQYAPFGMRVRLKAGVDISYMPQKVQVIARALKKYGMLMADNGGNWFVSGAPDSRWNNDELVWLGYLTAGDFEVVKMGTIVTP